MAGSRGQHRDDIRSPGSTQAGVDEVDHALQGDRTGLGGGIADEAAAFALVKRKIDLSPALSVALHKALQIRLWVNDVLCALHVEDWWHVDGLSAIEDADRIALLHRLLGSPEPGMLGDH